MARKAMCWSSAVLVGLLVLMPLSVSAQQASGIAGAVQDDTGGVLPGVTVEVASPALIEGIRTAFTDGEGRYNVTPLPPGTYSVTFTLPGFSTIIREGVELTGGFTAAINVEMQVGGIEETITVTGASPVVDVQNVRQQTTVSDELLAALPSGTKGLMGMVRLIPGITTGAVEGGGGASGIYGANRIQSAVLHGKGGANQTYDGMNTLNLATTREYHLHHESIDGGGDDGRNRGHLRREPRERYLRQHDSEGGREHVQLHHRLHLRERQHASRR